MKGLLLYRLLSMIVNIFAMLLAFFVFISVPAIFGNPVIALPLFLFASIALYAFFANKFFIIVKARQEIFTKKQTDWLQVNAIVTAIVVCFWLLGSVSIYINPMPALQTLEARMPAEYTGKITATEWKKSAIALIILFSIILTHVIWTVSMLRAHRKLTKNIPDLNDNN